MSAETPNPQPGDRVRVTYVGMYEPTPHGPLLVSDGSPKRSIFEDAIIEVLERALCPEIEGATGIRCQQPTGHVGGHKGTTTEEQTKAVGYPLFVSWPAESEPPARRSVRVPNEPHGPAAGVLQLVREELTQGHALAAVNLLKRATGWSLDEAREYVESMSEYQAHLSEHGRTEVDPTEARRMRDMGFDKQPELRIGDEQRAEILAVLDERAHEYVYGGAHGWRLDKDALAGVVADIVYAAIVQDRKRGDR